MAVVAIGAYVFYAIVILGRAGGHSLTAVPYAAVLLWTVIASIVANIVAEIGFGVAGRRASRLKDERDREIGRFGELTGQSFVIIGAVSATLMAMAGWDRFWIANVIYLCFTLSAVLGSVTKIISYRRTFPQW
jgi:hypothetical protein